MMQFYALLVAGWADLVTKQIDDKLQTEWQSIVTSSRTYGTWHIGPKQGNWVVKLGGWTYLLDDRGVRCNIDAATGYQICDGAHTDAPLTFEAAAQQPIATVARLRALHKALFNNGLTIDIDAQGVGHATLEAVVHTPNAQARTSRRYLVRATLTATGYTLEVPQFVEQFDEKCYAVNGCHDTYWTCTRL